MYFIHDGSRKSSIPGNVLTPRHVKGELSVLRSLSGTRREMFRVCVSNRVIFAILLPEECLHFPPRSEQSAQRACALVAHAVHVAL